MMAYVGQTRSRALIQRLTGLGIGECTSRGELPPRRIPWFYDNGAFTDWKAGRPFAVEAFERDLERISRDHLCPDFIVAPDIVAGGHESLMRSVAWANRCANSAPTYLVVQDGMKEADVIDAFRSFHGLFVGGTKEWKRKTAHNWCSLAHSFDKPCHIGRVGSAADVAWAWSCYADSIDSSAPLWSNDNLRRFLSGLDFGERQQCLAVWDGGPH